MSDSKLEHLTHEKLSYSDYLPVWMTEFINDRKAQNLTEATIAFYGFMLKQFADYCEAQAVTQISQITPGFIRQYMVTLSETHKPGGVHCAFRTIRAFFNWWENEAAPDGWKNPMSKIKAPKIGQEPLQPVKEDDFSRLLDACKGNDLMMLRDKALFLALLDTGARARELLAVNREDLDQVTGQILIKRGKGRKPRLVFLGRAARKAVRTYLTRRADNHPALWLTIDNEPLKYAGLRQIIRRASERAGLTKPPAIHSFRRAFALAMLRNGTDIFTLQKLMGHSDITILRRYLAQTDDDVRTAHAKNGPVDRLLG